MVLTVTQTTAFFENPGQMAIPNVTRVQLAVEGITMVADLINFDKDLLDQVANNLRLPGGGVNPFVFGGKSHKRLLVASKLVKYHHAVGRALSANNMQWNQVCCNFE